jgi:outer membrane receptor protein involved in Fe transport
MAKQYADPENRVPMPDYALLDSSAWFKTERASVVLSVRNLLDERAYYGSSINQWAPNPQVTPGPGREVLCTLRLQL